MTRTHGKVLLPTTATGPVASTIASSGRCLCTAEVESIIYHCASSTARDSRSRFQEQLHRRLPRLVGPQSAKWSECTVCLGIATLVVPFRLWMVSVQSPTHLKVWLRPATDSAGVAMKGEIWLAATPDDAAAAVWDHVRRARYCGGVHHNRAMAWVRPVLLEGGKDRASSVSHIMWMGRPRRLGM